LELIIMAATTHRSHLSNWRDVGAPLAGFIASLPPAALAADAAADLGEQVPEAHVASGPLFPEDACAELL
jgi:hypothetical protein